MSVGFLARALLLGLATHAVVATIAALLVAATWRRLAAAPAARPPRTLARRLLVLRAAPSLCGATAAALVVLAFVRFEPEAGAERVGVALMAAAAVGALWMAGALARGWRTARSVRRLPGPAGRHPVDAKIGRATRRLADAAGVETVVVDTAFPVMALAGWLRPRLLVSRRLAEACTESELAAMIAHESAHLRSRDNLARAVFALAPDPLAVLPAGAALEAAWSEAVEQAADESATGDDRERRLALAEALVKVARLAVSSGAAPAGVSALFRGEPIADRVRRLLSPPPTAERSRDWLPAAVALVVLGVAAGVSLLGLPEVHALAESAIRWAR